MPNSVPLIISECYSDYNKTVCKETGKVTTAAKCKFCKEKKTVAECGSTTTNYIRHIKLAHRGRYERYVAVSEERQSARQQTLDETQPTLTSMMDVKRYGVNHHKQKTLLKSITMNLVIDSSLPFSIVETEGFVRFLGDLDPHYNAVSRKAVMATITSECKSIKQQLKEDFIPVQTVCVTLDIWSDRNCRGFLGVTCHYIKDGKIRSGLLACNRMKGSHTGESIYNSYQAIIDEYKLSSKIKYIITDNASNMKKAFKVVWPSSEDEVELDDETMWEDHELRADALANIPHQRLSCFAHSLQLVVGDGLKQTRCMNTAMAKVSKISSLAHTSTSFKEALEAAFGQGVSIPQANATRWNSTLKTVDAILKRGMTELNEVCTTDGRRECIFVNREWSQLVELAEILEPFRQATDLTQGDQIVTISSIVPFVLSLYSHTCKYEATYLTILLATLRDSLMSRFLGVMKMCGMGVVLENADPPFHNKVYTAAAILDPKYQLFWVDAEIDMPEAELELTKRELKVMVAEWAEQLTPSTATANLPPPPVAEVEVVQEPPKKTRPSLCSYSKRAPMETATNSAVKTAAQELGQYLSTTATTVTDPVTFWMEKRTIYPKLFKLSMVLFSIPATSAPVERVFSHSGLFLRPHRARMSAIHLSELVMAKVNRMK